MAKSDTSAYRVAANNRRARHNYEIEDTIEAGIMLMGSEVKSLREGRATIAESYAKAENGEIWLINATIPEYKQAGPFNHEPTRPRKLLLKQREIAKLIGATERAGMSLVPMKLYFNNRGIAKLEIGLGKGKKHYDKRETERNRDWNMQKARMLSHKR
ncbi:MAG: SsrA-binding protein [Paracoccaceae bacterium]|jgi:SsrA-binding protein